ncbi:MAG: bifunctional diaminohydroxyphosphoribosylaminopyrimidine deaminase/5-amino-6-(5-phosphoribosylamino)uracil reductase RibD [Firmicutes bacterium]|nr:bifunctional diaminohydroxyphosphoribosylaminopyrimidine deaminase/5-amino-6-(5-phosphoribosylamino)uracil reductase RibD [Bacillota bacterium]
MWTVLDLARKGRGLTNPNPMVGAVVVKNGEVVSTGYHGYAGGPHAEYIALQKAGEKARGATLYANLEPCCHRGKTPPCVESIHAAGISKVVVAMKDPNPIVNGKGINWLREKGVKVKVGVLEDKARRLNEVFIKYITTRRPFVIVKAAMSFDGKIATREGDSRWITGKKSRQMAHQLRNRADAIIVGINTISRDDPVLTTRLTDREGRDADRIILDSRARLPLDAKVINPSSRATTIVAATEAASPERCGKLRERGVEVLLLPAKGGRVSLEALMIELGKRKYSSLLVEGGGTVNYSFLEENLIDKIYLFLAPIIFGGQSAPTPFAGEGIDVLKKAWMVSNLDLKQYDEDLLLIGYPHRHLEKEARTDVHGNY